jgi:uncharacterized protein YndB with AHSA1/START domain
VSGDWFVGFRPMGKKPKGFLRAEHRVRFDISAPVSRVFTALVTRETISAILDETVRFDPRHGGKLRFISTGDDGYGGTYSLIQVPKRVVIITERHGELDFRLRDGGPVTPLDLRAARMSAPEETDSWIALVNEAAGRLRANLTES